MRADNAAKAAGRRTARGTAAQARQAAGTVQSLQQEETGVDTQAVGGLPGLLAGGGAAFSPDEAEAAPRPKYMEELVAKLKSGDYTPMEFGTISRRTAQKAAEGRSGLYRRAAQAVGKE